MKHIKSLTISCERGEIKLIRSGPKMFRISEMEPKNKRDPEARMMISARSLANRIVESLAEDAGIPPAIVWIEGWI